MPRFKQPSPSSRLPLMQLSVADRQQGATATDQNICANFGHEISDCRVSRAATGFVVHDGYSITAEHERPACPGKSGERLRLLLWSLKGRWDTFINFYRRQGQQADLDQGDPQTNDYTITLSGGQMGNTDSRLPGTLARGTTWTWKASARIASCAITLIA